MQCRVNGELTRVEFAECVGVAALLASSCILCCVPAYLRASPAFIAATAVTAATAATATTMAAGMDFPIAHISCHVRA